jgi:hypothetical protein
MPRRQYSVRNSTAALRAWRAPAARAVGVACGAGSEPAALVTVGVAAPGMTTVLVSPTAISSPAVIIEIPGITSFFMMPPGLMVSY